MKQERTQEDNMRSKALVTGNAGFIGSHLVDKLIEIGYEVYGIDNLSTGKKENINKECKFTKLDLCDGDKLFSYVDRIRPDVTFHLAALARIQPSIEDPIKWNDNNVNATLNLLVACNKAGVKKIVFSSSSSVYGDNKVPFKESQLPQPKNPYALSKYVCERWCQLFVELYGMDITILRYFNVYGKRQVLEGDYATVIGIFINQMQNGKKLTIVGDGTQKRDFTYVKDVVRANVLASNKKGFGIYNIGTGKTYKIKDVAKIIQPNDTMHEFGYQRSTEAKVTLAKNKKAKKELGWFPQHDLNDGITESL